MYLCSWVSILPTDKTDTRGLHSHHSNLMPLIFLEYGASLVTRHIRENMSLCLTRNFKGLKQEKSCIWCQNVHFGWTHESKSFLLYSQRRDLTAGHTECCGSLRDNATQDTHCLSLTKTAFRQFRQHDAIKAAQSFQIKLYLHGCLIAYCLRLTKKNSAKSLHNVCTHKSRLTYFYYRQWMMVMLVACNWNSRPMTQGLWS